jgi:predicted N-acetyltransferase YhbS
MSHLLVRQVQPGEYRAAGYLVAQVFHEDERKRQQIFDYWINRQPQEPGFDYAMHRVAIFDGKVVSYAMVKPYVLRYGRVKLRVAGVGAVCTHPDYRQRGYASAVLQDTLAYMAEQGVHLALLDGVRGYYDRFGFSPVWPYYFFEVPAAEAAALEPPLSLREPSAQDVPQMARLYQKHWEGRVAFVRSPESWMWRVLYDDWGYVRVVEDAEGQIGGYIAGPDPTDSEIEVVADTPDAAMTMLAECGRLCLDAGLDAVRWFMPPDDAVVAFARPLLPVTVSARYLPDGDWMARLIDTHGLLETLLPELIAQANLADPHFDPDTLHFGFMPDQVRLGLRGRDTATCHLDHRDFIQIMFGSLRPSALALRPHTRLHPDGVRLLEMLFPPRMAALGCWDWF